MQEVQCRHCERKPGKWKNGYCSPECAIEAEQSKPITIEDRFMNFVDKNGPIPTPTNGREFSTSCWIWTGTVTGQKGHEHPQTTLGGKHKVAARVAWILFKDEPINNQKVIHGCQNRLCVNPDHLFLGTQGDALRNGRRR